jgi:hypothetical protein
MQMGCWVQEGLRLFAVCGSRGKSFGLAALKTQKKGRKIKQLHGAHSVLINL